MLGLMGVFDGKSYIEEGFESFRGGLRDPGALRPCQKWCLCGHFRGRGESVVGDEVTDEGNGHRDEKVGQGFAGFPV